MTPPGLTPQERVMRRVERVQTEYGECWLWQGATAKGYGKIGAYGKIVSCHKLMYETEFGLVPEGLELDHLCKNRICCNPTHLEAVTGKVNRSRTTRSRRSVCIKGGHPMTEDNIYRYTKSNGREGRACKACRSDYVRKWREAR